MQGPCQSAAPAKFVTWAVVLHPFVYRASVYPELTFISPRFRLDFVVAFYLPPRGRPLHGAQCQEDLLPSCWPSCSVCCWLWRQGGPITKPSCCRSSSSKTRARPISSARTCSTPSSVSTSFPLPTRIGLRTSCGTTCSNCKTM